MTDCTVTRETLSKNANQETNHLGQGRDRGQSNANHLEERTMKLVLGALIIMIGIAAGSGMTVVADLDEQTISNVELG